MCYGGIENFGNRFPFPRNRFAELKVLTAEFYLGPEFETLIGIGIIKVLPEHAGSTLLVGVQIERVQRRRDRTKEKEKR